MPIDPAKPDMMIPPGNLPGRGGDKAESLIILPPDARGLAVLVGHDGPKNGHIESCRLPLEPR